jgi:nitroreductase
VKLNLSADEVLTTTRSVRKRLDLTRPVPRDVLLECLEIALQAPTGSNRQGWQWMFVEDPGKKKALADLYGAHFDEYRKNPPSAAYPEGDIRAERRDAVTDSATYLRDHFHEVPVLMIPLIEGRLDRLPVFAAASTWGSLLPAVWSFMLALRERGLGSAWTTLHLPAEREAADVLGIPYERYTQAGLFPIAYTIGTDFKPAPRLPLDGLVHFDTW